MECSKDSVHCMVYLPSNDHIVILGSTRNIQSTAPNQWDTGGRFDLQRHGKEQTSWVMRLKDTQLLSAIKTEPARANPLGVNVGHFYYWLLYTPTSLEIKDLNLKGAVMQGNFSWTCLQFCCNTSWWGRRGAGGAAKNCFRTVMFSYSWESLDSSIY